MSLSHLTPIRRAFLSSVCPAVCRDHGADPVSLVPPPTLQPHRLYSGSRSRACRLRRVPRSPCGVSCLSPMPPWSGARAVWSCRLTSAGSLGSGAAWRSLCCGTCAGRTRENTHVPVDPRPPVPPSPFQVGPKARAVPCAGPLCFGLHLRAAAPPWASHAGHGLCGHVRPGRKFSPHYPHAGS